MRGKTVFISLTPWLLFFGLLLLMFWLMTSISDSFTLLVCTLFFGVASILFVRSRNQAQRAKGYLFVALTDILLLIMLGVSFLVTSFTVENGQIAQVLGNTVEQVPLFLIAILGTACINAYFSS